MSEDQKSETVHRFISDDGFVRASVVYSTHAVRYVCEKQKTTPEVSVLLGRTLTGALLMASSLKEGYLLGIELRGEGPAKRVFAEAGYEGSFRAYCQEPTATMREEFTSLGDMLGVGTLSADVTYPQQTRPYRGMVDLQTGEVGDDLSYYLFQSQQIPSIVSLAVGIGPDGNVTCAGGIIIELLPGHTEDIILKLEEAAMRAPSLVERLSAGVTEKEILQDYLKGIAMSQLKHEYRIFHQCRCSKDRVLSAFRFLDRHDLESIAASSRPTEVTCEFCKHVYRVDASDLAALMTKH